MRGPRKGNVTRTLILNRETLTQESGTDPARSGLSEGVIKYLLRCPARTLIYVSCNPGTQARIVTLYFQIALGARQRKVQAHWPQVISGDKDMRCKGCMPVPGPKYPIEIRNSHICRFRHTSFCISSTAQDAHMCDNIGSANIAPSSRERPFYMLQRREGIENDKKNAICEVNRST